MTDTERTGRVTTTERVPAETEADEVRVYHTEEEERPRVEETHEVREGVVGPAPLGLGIRIALTILGAAGFAIGAFLPWLASSQAAATEIPIEGLWRTAALTGSTTIALSIGAVSLLLAALALVAFAARTGWLTRLVGALGLVVFGAFAISMALGGGFELPGDIGLGAWLVLAAGIVTIIAGFYGTRVRAQRIER